MCVGHDHSSRGMEGQKSRLKVKLQSVGPQVVVILVALCLHSAKEHPLMKEETNKTSSGLCVVY